MEPVNDFLRVDTHLVVPVQLMPAVMKSMKFRCSGQESMLNVSNCLWGLIWIRILTILQRNAGNEQDMITKLNKPNQKLYKAFTTSNAVR